MADETTDYMPLVNERIKKAVLDNYATTAGYTTAFNSLKTSLGITDEKWNEFMNSAVADGVSPETALDIFILTLSMK